jgi:hypothetical protein
MTIESIVGLIAIALVVVLFIKVTSKIARIAVVIGGIAFLIIYVIPQYIL